MTSETYPASLVSRFAVPDQNRMPQGYYRSKLFVAAHASNPLIAAAGPLFSLLERLCISPMLPPIHSIRDNIDHELKAFYSRMTSQHYPEESVIIAQYLLSATIDELLGKNYLRLYGYPAEFNAFTPSSVDDTGPEQRFFDIVHYIKERPTQYLDLIELAYYCLIAGFEGTYHLRSDGRQTLDNLIEELFQFIQQHRVHQPARLFKEKIEIMSLPMNYKPMITALVVTILALTTLYFGSHTLLDHKAKTLLLSHTVLASTEH